jgi:hypothetical protein
MLTATPSLQGCLFPHRPAPRLSRQQLPSTAHCCSGDEFQMLSAERVCSLCCSMWTPCCRGHRHQHRLFLLSDAGCPVTRTLGGPTLTSKSTVRPTRRNLAHPDVSCSPRNRVQLAQTAADFHSLPTSLEAAAAEMALQAAPGSSWPAKTHAVIDTAHRAMGGNFLLVVCGHWADLHPRAETSAFALLQMVFVSVDEGDGLYKVHGKPGWCQLGPATTDCCKIRERSSTKP